jgi:hypothetical protein
MGWVVNATPLIIIIIITQLLHFFLFFLIPASSLYLDEVNEISEGYIRMLERRIIQ